tara:strand:+ start:1774 stop:2163 length:390 start_codon:yes stop_codon:yes gene_type:complete
MNPNSDNNMNTDYDNEAMQTREYQRASRSAAIKKQQPMTAEDIKLSQTAPTRTVQDWIAEGYTKPYAKALVAQANRLEAVRTEQIRSSQTRAEVLSTIDELNQYLLGNVTIEAATDAARELYYKLNEKW